jgi:predicted SnoaL-like aldol condensation-catalyzing enzyme
MPSPLAIVNRFLTLTSSSGADLPKVVDLLTDDVCFSGPLMRITGRDAYVSLLQRFVPAHVCTRVLRQFEEGDEVCSINELTVRAPSGSTVTLAMAEWFRLREGRIFEHTIFYDPREFAAAFGMVQAQP